MTHSDTDPTHPGPTEIAGYVDDMLPAGERARVEAHLADCAECRHEVVEVRRLVISPPRDRRWVWLIPGTAAVAAAVAALLLINTAGEISQTADPPLRAAAQPAQPDAALPRPTVHAPVGTVPRDGVVLAWGAVAPGAVYRVSVSTAAGTLIWAGSSIDTLLALPAGTALQPDTRYFWSVDALLPDGRSTSSGVHEFATGP